MQQKISNSSVNIGRRYFFRLLARGFRAGAGMIIPISFFSPIFTTNHRNAAKLEFRNKKSSMGYRRLGKTNIMISEISFGCALNYGCNPVGNELGKKIHNLFDRAIDCGINLFDISPNEKGGYIPEKYFKHFKDFRKEVLLSTKVDDFEPAATRRSIERSLRRMNTDYIDVVFLHNMGQRGGWRKGIPALKEIRKMIGEEKVRFAGISDHNYNNLLKIYLYKDMVDVIQFKYNIHRANAAENVIFMAKLFDIGTIAMKVFGGAYQCWQTKDAEWRNENTLAPFITNSNNTASAALKFVLSNDNLSSALVGMRSENQITENTKACSPIF